MEWHLSIPKVLHVYWGGDKMSYMRYLTVKSFMQYNPDWKVTLWLPKYESVKTTWKGRELNYEVKCDDWFPALKSLPIEQQEVDFVDHEFGNDIAEVHKSDYLRLHLLATQGGLWSDMDIIYFRPITALAVNVEINKDKDTFVCMAFHGNYNHSAGFLMATQESRYYDILKRKCLSEYNPNNYQGIGVEMFNKYYPDMASINKVCSAVNIGMEAVYAHDALHVPEFFSSSVTRFTKNSIGVHWYAGHPLWAKFIELTNGGIKNLGNSIICNVLKQFPA
jgi:hypothetical protein